MDLLSGFMVDEEIGASLFNMLLALVAGVVIAAGYVLANKNQKYSKNFVITVLLMPAIMAVIIPFVASDLKKTLSLAGIFALVRFRSIPGDSKDILYVFFSLSVGVMIALNSYFIAFVTVFVVSAIFILMTLCWKVEDKQVLKITIPEDMNYKDVFNDIFDRYLEKYGVKNVKTSNMGTLFTISYWVQPKKDIDTKAFIDELRTRNGNLNIILENPEDLEIPVL